MPLQIYNFDSVGNGVRAPLGTTDDMLVVQGVTVGREDAVQYDDYTVEADGSFQTVKVDGLITGGSCIQIGDTTADFQNKVLVGETGSIQSVTPDGAAIAVHGSSATIDNRGSIWAEDYGIQLYGSLGGQLTRIMNSGVIEAKTGAIYRGNGTQMLSIENSGHIQGNYAFVSNGNAIDVFVNTGTVSGTLLFGGGDDDYLGGIGTIAGTVYGEDGDDELTGGANADDLRGGDHNDTLNGGGGDDQLNGDGDHDILSGGAGSDKMSGGSGVDFLDGGTGNDEMSGGIGEDTFVVDSAGDVVVELIGGGIDTVRTTASHTLADNVENLFVDSAGAIDATGNGLINAMQGNAGANVLSGLGNADTLLGMAGNDTLIGGAGADVMKGGVGNDTYWIDSTDSIEELAGQGIDTVISTVTRALGANFENLVLNTGGTANGTGNALANKIDGGAGVNTLLGGAGNDTLSGFGGKDTLSGGVGNDVLTGGALADRLFGGAGADKFVFKAVVESRGSTSDKIVDFSRSQRDKIDLGAIDASTKARGNQAFSFIGDAEFSRKAGELRYEKIGRDTHVQADINGDGKADFSVISDVVTTFLRGDFVL